MITATCINQTCPQCGIAYNVYGLPTVVQCGQCGTNCELTDPQPDPIPAEPLQ